ncbi:MAG: MarR family transcriptional regulator [Fluviicola sp.]|jgi:MarR family 2-MHQ and catechol resistance regulon transcriptional repressor|nr:MarR family transcriptional regulator [Fluviicola sp.]
MNIEEALNTKFSSAQQKVIINLRYTSNILSNYQNNFLSEYNISIAQFNILRILRGAKGELNVNTVKERMIEKSPNTTRLMDKLLAKEFIARRNCSEDRRVVYVEITKKGLNLLKVLDSKIQEASFTPKNITDEESELLSNLLDKLRGEFH